MPESKLKMFVNNPELWGSFLEEIDTRIAFTHKQLEQMDDTVVIHRLQGEVKALRSLKMLREKVNNG